MKPIPQPRRPDPQAIAAMKQPVDDPVVAGITARPSQAFTASSQLTKLTVRLDRNLLGRVRAAFVAEGLPSGHTSLSMSISTVCWGESRLILISSIIICLSLSMSFVSNVELESISPSTSVAKSKCGRATLHQ